MNSNDMGATQPIKLSNSILKSLYIKLCSKCDFNKLLTVNRDNGCYNESHDYVQETLITLLNKIKDNKVQFYSDKALWSWCTHTLKMLLMRYHRDYTIVQSRTGRLVDISGEMQNGSKVEDIACNKVSNYEAKLEDQLNTIDYQNCVLAYTENTATVVPISQLYTIDIACKIVNLATILDDIKYIGVDATFAERGIAKHSVQFILDALCEYLKVDRDVITRQNKVCTFVNAPKMLGTRDKDLLRQVRKVSSKNKAVELKELEALCLSNSLNH